jgi:Xaa-Pro aminopeptidase
MTPDELRTKLYNTAQAVSKWTTDTPPFAEWSDLLEDAADEIGRLQEDKAALLAAHALALQEVLGRLTQVGVDLQRRLGLLVQQPPDQPSTGTVVQ